MRFHFFLTEIFQHDVNILFGIIFSSLTMPTYTLEELLAVRDKYTESPYLGFSLAAVCSNRNPHKLIRGAGAYKPKRVSSDKELLQRNVLVTLNKLSTKNYDTILNELISIPYFWTEDAIAEFTKQIFQKAENEQVFIAIYAKLCTDLVQHEKRINETKKGENKLLLLPCLLDRSKKVFSLDNMPQKASDTSQEYTEELKALHMRRKRAAVGFVGHLYLVGVLSTETILQLLDILLDLHGHKREYPEPHLLELSVELLDTIGMILEQQMGLAEFAEIISRIDHIKQVEDIYKPRVKFMLLNLQDRYNSGWEPYGSRNHTVTSKRATKSVTTPDGLFSPNYRNATSIHFPESPTPPPSTETAKTQFVDSAEIERVRKLVASLWQRWSPGDGKIENWDMQIMMDATPLHDKLASASTVGVIDFACLSSKEAVQRDAVAFLVEGLGCTSSELRNGLTRTLRKAFEHDVATDAPLYYKRFASIVLQIQGKLETSSEWLIEILFNAAGFISHLVVQNGLESEGILTELVGIACTWFEGVSLPMSKLLEYFKDSGMYEKKFCVSVMRKLIQKGLLSPSDLEKACVVVGINDPVYALIDEHTKKH